MTMDTKHDEDKNDIIRPSLLLLSVWFGLNCAMSHHMLYEPRKNYVRLTCLTQHAVTIFSLSLLLCDSTMDDDNTNEEHEYSHYHQVVHTQLTLLSSKIGILFTGLLCVIGAYYGATNSPITKKKKVTVMRILRNVYTHYGVCLILWWLGPSNMELSVSSLHVCNMILITWLVLVSPWITKIYDVEQLRTSQLVVPLAVLSVLTDVLLMRWLDVDSTES